MLYSNKLNIPLILLYLEYILNMFYIYKPDIPERVEFIFKEARIKVPPIDLKLPPFGKVYMLTIYFFILLLYIT